MVITNESEAQTHWKDAGINCSEQQTVAADYIFHH